MKCDNITYLAYLNTLEENKKPFDLLMEIIEIECYQFQFSELGIITEDKKNIKDIIFEKYSIIIEEYALKKWISRKFVLLENKIVRKGTKTLSDLKHKISELNNNETIFLNKVSKIREKFIDYSNSFFNKKLSNEDAKNIFNDYIYTVSKDKKINNNNQEYYIFQQFLKKLCKEEPESLEIIENFGIANQIQDLILNFDLENTKFLENCIIFLDTPLLMKFLGYDGVELAETYEIFFNELKKAGAKLSIFEHTFEELWGILFNFKRCVVQNNFDAKGVSTFLKARSDFLKEKKQELSLDKENVKKVLEERFGDFIDITDVDDLCEKQDYSSWTFNTKVFEECLNNTGSNYNNYKNRLKNDICSVSAIFRLRSKEKIINPNSFKEGKYYLLVDNYALVDALKHYFQIVNEKKYKNELLLENSVIFYLWQNSSNFTSLNKSLFRGKCFALNTIDDNFKDKLYRETRKIEAYFSENTCIMEEIINSPYLENEIYEETIKNNSFDKEYISKTLNNKILEREKKHTEELKTKDKIINSKIKEIELLNEKQQNELNKQKIDSQRNTEKILSEYQAELVDNKINELKNNFLFKIQIIFLKILNKNVDDFLTKKAYKILGIK